jgi:RNA polymerase sigma-70 factor (ECF subfamily)
MFKANIDFHELARRLRAHDEDAYEFVIESYSRRIICYLTKVGVPYDEANDIWGDCKLELWETSCESYDPNQSSFWTWLSKVVRNLAFDRGRRNLRAKFVALDEARFIVDPKAVDEKFSGKYDWELIETAKESLNTSDQEVINLKYGYGLTYDEIAQISCSSQAAAGMRVTRAVQRLRSSIEGLNNNEPRGPDYGPGKSDSS